MMKVFLIGFMGCGKSTMGRKLARQLGYDFIDLDHEIEKRTDTTIGNYFSVNGEMAFRELERKTLQEFDYPVNCIVATGGGVPCYFDNMDWMNANGTTVYIEMSPMALAGRLERGKDKRPLLKDLNEAQMIAFIEGKLAEREGYYKRAKLNVEGINLSADTLSALIITKD
jgi:shikimate kinase